MRNKIKQMMKKEEGFTLVELLAVIVILGIIVAIAVPSIGNVISRAEDGAVTAEEELVVDAARLYMVENDVPADNKLLVSKLISTGFLEETDSANVETTDHVLVTTTAEGNYIYEYNGTTP